MLPRAKLALALLVSAVLLCSPAGASPGQPYLSAARARMAIRQYAFAPAAGAVLSGFRARACRRRSAVYLTCMTTMIDTGDFTAGGHVIPVALSWPAAVWAHGRRLFCTFQPGYFPWSYCGELAR